MSDELVVSRSDFPFSIFHFSFLICHFRGVALIANDPFLQMETDKWKMENLLLACYPLITHHFLLPFGVVTLAGAYTRFGVCR